MLITITKKPGPTGMGTGTDAGGSRWKVAQQCLYKYYNKYERNGTGITKGTGSNWKAVRGSAVHESLCWLYNVLNGQLPPGLPEGVYPETFDTSNTKHIGMIFEISLAMGMQVIKNSTFEPEFEEDLKKQLAITIDRYMEHYQDELFNPKDDGLKVEQTEIYIESDILHKRYTARLDLIGKYGDVPIIGDHKTTGMHWSIYQKGLKRDLSLMGYVYNARKKYNIPYQMLINGIHFKSTKVFDVDFQRDLITYSDYHMEEFEKSLGKIHSDIDCCKENNEWPQNGESCMSHMVECEYYGLCNNPETEFSYEAKPSL